MNETADPIRPPRQARSRATLSRLLETARAMLTECEWRELAVTDLCDRASSSVGSFYARFRDKDALLESLATEAASELGEVAAWCEADATRRALPPISRLRQLTAALARYADRHGGVLRALVTEGRALPWSDRNLRQTLGRLVGGEATAPTKRDAALATLLAACQARALTDGGGASPDPDALAHMLALFLADGSGSRNGG